MKKTVTLSFRIEDRFDEYDVDCARNGVKLNIAIWDAINKIRSQLKYNDEGMSDKEREFLESLRSDLSEAYIEE